MTISLRALFEKREQLKTGLAPIRDLRRGSLTARFRKCGKLNCHCAQKDFPGHGPSYSLTRADGGKTITQVLSKEPEVIVPGRRFPKTAVFASLSGSPLANNSAMRSYSSRKRWLQSVDAKQVERTSEA